MVRPNKQEPRVSATYIRSLVKQQLTSSTTMTTTTTDGSGGGKTQTQTQTHKKQVRRRLHTSRPYQERLLNMAEARREIVTALKQHRASMRQATRIPPPQPPPPPPPQPLNPPDPFSWTNPSLNFLLPNQPLGLNLNFQDFNDFIQTSSTTSSSSSSSTSSSSSSIFPTNPHIYSSPSPPPTFTTANSDSAPQPPSSSNGENNVITSAWWSELMMKTVEPEIKPETEEVAAVEDDVFPKLSDVMEFPSWLNQTEEELFHPYNLTDNYSSPHNPPLSCMEIGEIEGMDGDDWFA
ncbi:unnamed protein product [Arabidopsis lyrata]|uniref:Hydroxyproline-rich glycoprotein family protein n=1 Tax=Arabidopsis lyrata subsp. lyrata TaxID=81972 RepID=D7M0S3_ARALL|nr:putative uncharacterized protein DDB_G0285869 [Arabidopsis lyrata subsp. lyrata]EFH50298.1 hypothetical protein ARALYDRAFT_489044 [Arabidopsis lyrata subsp. lyrata]CAH8271817.1 unnamed protein product [Arabidopsis lyrata]|eukprot:XP_020878558.1 putative uncharacterized protein DDB_G0285869 [Arabidopsis lyrata subsp. lyrata]